MGRIPLQLDTDCCLPLENIIPYEKFIILLPIKELPNLDVIIKKKHDEISYKEFEDMQKSARYYFEKYLRIDNFFKYVFEQGYINKYL